MFDNLTAKYAITAGNDKKIRYWNLQDPSKLSFQVNTPRDDEAFYISERLTRDTLVVQERQLNQKEFPRLSASRVSDKESSYQSPYISFRGQNVWLKYAENTSCKFKQ